MRYSLLREPALWTGEVCAFPSTTAVTEIISRTRDEGIELDFYRLLRYAPPDDVAALMALFFDTAVPRPTPALSLAYDIATFYPKYIGTGPPSGFDFLSTVFCKGMSGHAFANLVSVSLFVTSTFTPFVAPALEYFSLTGVKPSTSLTTAWIGSPKVKLSHLSLVLGGKFLRTVVLGSLSLENDVDSTPVHRSLRLNILRLRRPSNVEVAVRATRGVASTRSIAITRTQYGDTLPPWVWRFSGLHGEDSLVMVTESSRNVVWVTFFKVGDSEPGRPAFCDGTDEYDINSPVKDRPTLFVRPGRISRRYLLESHPSYKGALVRDIAETSARIRQLHVAEITVDVDDRQVWLRAPLDFVNTVLRPLVHITNLSIEDERMAHLPLYISPACTRLSYYCRADWIGKSGLHDFAQAVQRKSAQLQEVTVVGMTRTCDAMAYSILDSVNVTVTDERRPLPSHDVRSYHEKKLDDLKRLRDFYYVSAEGHFNCNR